MKLKLHLPTSAKKLRATATARQFAPSREMDEEEPTMKLSTAFVLVLLLHLIAVGGILAFNTVKAHRATRFSEPETKSLTSETPTVAEQASSRAAAKSTGANSAVAPVSAPQTSSRASEGAKTVELPKKPGFLTGPRDSGVVHTVIKGENPERIAHKFGVSFNDLIKLNHIEDPTKLRIGQKLHIPVKIKATASN